MSDSTHEAAGEDRPKRNQGTRRNDAGGARGGAPKRDGERRSTGDRSGYGRPDRERRDGDRKPYGERKPYGAGSRDGERKPHGGPARDGERKSYGSTPRDGERKPYSGSSRDVERKSYGAGSRDGERKSYGRPARDGERKTYGSAPRDGERKSYGRPARDGERKTYGSAPRDGERKSYGAGARDGERKPYGAGPRDGERRPYGAGSRDGERKTYGRPARDGERKSYGAGSRDGERKPYGRPTRDGDRPSYGRPQREGDRRGRDDGRSTERAPRIAGHGAADLRVRPRHDDPEIDERITPRDLDSAARSELKTLSKENADQVARHLVAAAEALEFDPQLAHRHALSAARRAGRVGVVRETLAITAYATGDFTLALRELRTYRRLTGRDDQLPLMVDSERGVGRPDRALELGRSVDRSTLSASVQAALAIAMSGARLDLGQPELALAELEVPQLDPDRAFSYSPALFSAYAEVLDELDRTADAARWRGLAERAEAALEGTLPDLVEVFEIEEDGTIVEIDETAVEIAEAVAETAETAQPSQEEHGASHHSGVDPADAIEPEVAAILAETAELDDEDAPEPDESDDEDTEHA